MNLILKMCPLRHSLWTIRVTVAVAILYRTKAAKCSSHEDAVRYPTTRRALPDGESVLLRFCAALASLQFTRLYLARRPIVKDMFFETYLERTIWVPLPSPSLYLTKAAKYSSHEVRFCPTTHQAVPVDGSAHLRVCRCPCLSSLGVECSGATIPPAVWPRVL